MCNYLTEHAQALPQEGYGWKVFIVFEGQLCQPNFKIPKFYTAKNEWYRYKSLKLWSVYYCYGFCFFTSMEDAKKGLLYIDTHWHYDFIGEYVIKKIQYKGGLGKQFEEGVGGIMTGLCKQFRVLPDECQY